MYDNDYIIAIDENGQPYIAHSKVGDAAKAAWGSVSGRAVKYYDKIRTSTGKWRYFYSPEELKAYRAYRQANKSGNVSGQEKAAKQAEWKKAQARVESNRQLAVNKAKNKANSVANSAKRTFDKYDGGISEYARYKKANKSGNVSGQEKARLQREWNESSLGKASKKLKSAPSSVKNTVSRYGKTTLSAIKGAGKSAKSTFDKYDGGISEYIRYKKANKSGNVSGQEKARLQREWNESSLGKLTSKKKNK